MKTIEEEFLLNQIEKCKKKKAEYLEVDNNSLATSWENKEWIYNNIYNLILDGYKYREDKTNEKINR